MPPRGDSDKQDTRLAVSSRTITSDTLTCWQGSGGQQGAGGGQGGTSVYACECMFAPCPPPSPPQVLHSHPTCQSCEPPPLPPPLGSVLYTTNLTLPVSLTTNPLRHQTYSPPLVSNTPPCPPPSPRVHLPPQSWSCNEGIACCWPRAMPPPMTYPQLVPH